MAQSMYQKRAAARRRTADITRLADQYQKNIQAITQNYEQAFGAYEADTAKTQGAYESRLSDYRSAFDVYQDQMAAYQQRASEYQKSLQAATKREVLPLEIRWDAKYNTFKYYGNNDTHKAGQLTARGREVRDMLASYGLVSPTETFSKRAIQFDLPSDWDFDITRQTTGGQIAYVQLSKQAAATPAPFSEKAPSAPTAPKAPVIKDFDASQFEEQRTQAETVYKRELGERKSARQAAVSRRGARPLLQGT